MGKIEKKLKKAKPKHKPIPTALPKVPATKTREYVVIERHHVEYFTECVSKFPTPAARDQHIKHRKHCHALEAERSKSWRHRERYTDDMTFETQDPKE